MLGIVLGSEDEKINKNGPCHLERTTVPLTTNVHYLINNENDNTVWIVTLFDLTCTRTFIEVDTKLKWKTDAAI